MRNTYLMLARGALGVAALHARDAAIAVADACFWFALSLQAGAEVEQDPPINVWHAPGREPRA